MGYRKLGVKLNLLVGIGTIIVLGVYAYVNITARLDHETQEIMNGGRQISDTINRSIRYSMLNLQRDNLEGIILAIVKQPEIERVRIFNKKGIVMYSSQEGEIGSGVDKAGESCYPCHQGERPIERLSTQSRSRIFRSKEGVKTLGMISPIYNERDCSAAECHIHPESQKILGVLEIGMSLESIDEEITANTWRMVLFAVITILGIYSIITLFIYKFVSQPVKKLVIGTEQIAKGDLEHHIPLKSSDEIGRLAESFNQMAQKLKSTNDQLIQSEKLASVGKLAAGVAHEINNPLTGVLTFGSLLLKQTDEADPRYEDTRVIIRETLRCREIVKGLLDFARQTKPKKVYANMNDIILKAVSFLENQASFQAIAIEKKLSRDLPHAMVDENQMQQVCLNILMNAKDAMPSGGTITIQTQEVPADGKIRIRFTDTGCGIPKENLNRLFEPFFSTKDGKGVGLGLAVLWGIMQKHEGDVKVESSVGKGTTFILDIPIESRRDSGSNV